MYDTWHFKRCLGGQIYPLRFACVVTPLRKAAWYMYEQRKTRRIYAKV